MMEQIIRPSGLVLTDLTRGEWNWHYSSTAVGDRGGFITREPLGCSVTGLRDNQFFSLPIPTATLWSVIGLLDMAVEAWEAKATI